MSQKYFDQIQEIFQGYTSGNFKSFGLVWSAGQIREALEKHQACIETFENQVTGFILYRQINPVLVEIDMTMTRSNLLKKGVMQNLFQKFKNSLQAGTEVWLEVHEKNVSAINLYKKMGFSTVGQRSHYYPDGGQALLMSLKIS